MHDLHVHGCIGVPQKEQRQHADVADKGDRHITHQGCFLALLLGCAYSECEERDRKYVAHHHHRHVESVIISHHTGVKHDQDRDVRRDGQSQFAGAAGHHQSLQRLVGFNDLDVFRDLNLLLLAAAKAEVLGLVFFPDSNDREDGKQH